jgi:WD40 repeat protein
VAGCYAGTIQVFDAQSGDRLSTVRGHTDVVTSVCFSSDGKELTSGSDDSTVRNWDPATRASLP